MNRTVLAFKTDNCIWDSKTQKQYSACGPPGFWSETCSGRRIFLLLRFSEKDSKISKVVSQFHFQVFCIRIYRQKDWVQKCGSVIIAQKLYQGISNTSFPNVSLITGGLPKQNIQPGILLHRSPFKFTVLQSLWTYICFC